MVLKMAFKYDLHRTHPKYCGEYSIDTMVTFFGLVFAQH